MIRLSFAIGLAFLLLACVGSARSEGIDEVLARARKLKEAGEPAEATAVLARAVSQTLDRRLVSEWLLINDHLGSTIESKQLRKAMPAMPQVDNAELRNLLGASAADAYLKEWTEHWLENRINPFGLFYRQFSAADEAYKQVRRQLDRKVPAIMNEQEVNTRIQAIEEYGRSAFSCESAISRALQSAPTGEIDGLLPLKKQAREQKKRVQRVRAEFISYDHIAPRVISAHVALISDAFGVTGPYVTEGSLKRAAEMLGEAGRDIEFAHKDVKRLWLDAMSKLKEATGQEQFKALETLATVVGNSKTTPDQWEPK